MGRQDLSPFYSFIGSWLDTKDGHPWVIQVIADYNNGYVFFDDSDTQTLKDGDYLEIPGEKKWYAFRR